MLKTCRFFQKHEKTFNNIMRFFQVNTTNEHQHNSEHYQYKPTQ